MPRFETTEGLTGIAEAEPVPGPTVIARFEIRYSRFLDPKGNVVRPLPDFARSRAELVALYRAMVLARRFDAKAVALQRTGRLGTFASALGQEAVPIGVASAMRSEDVLLPSFREHGAQLGPGSARSNCSCSGAATNGAAILLRLGRTSRSACRSARTRRTRWALRSPSSCGAKKGSRCAYSATERLRKGMSPRRSTLPGFSTFRQCS